MVQETSAKVAEVAIEYARGLFDMRFVNGSARATLRMSDGATETFEWYHDEISYSASDFVGKTMREIAEMHYRRDMAYLRS